VGRAFGRTITIRDGRVGAEGHAGEDYLPVARVRNLAMAQTGNIRLGRQPFMLRPLLNRLATADRDQVTPPRAAMLIHRILTGLSRSRRPWTQIPSCH